MLRRRAEIGKQDYRKEPSGKGLGSSPNLLQEDDLKVKDYE